MSLANANSGPIVSGPSKFDLAIALFDRKNGARGVEFHVNAPTIRVFKVVIQMIEIEHDSGESWNIYGYTTGEGAAKYAHSRKVRIYFRTDSRQGSFAFVS